MTIDSKSLIFSKLSDDSEVSSFACSDSKDLEDFLRNDAKTRQHEKISTTYLVHSGNDLIQAGSQLENDVVAYKLLLKISAI